MKLNIVKMQSGVAKLKSDNAKIKLNIVMMI